MGRVPTQVLPGVCGQAHPLGAVPWEQSGLDVGLLTQLGGLAGAMNVSCCSYLETCTHMQE